MNPPTMSHRGEHHAPDMDNTYVVHYDEESSESATNSSDEFWEDAAKEVAQKPQRAKRGRRLYLSFMQLYRPFRVFLVSTIISGLLITPFLVVKYVFPHSQARPHVAAWSIWFTITFACAGFIAIVVDLIPRLLISLIASMYGRPRASLTTELEIFMAVSFWLKTMCFFATLWVTLAVMRDIMKPPGGYWTYINRFISVLFTASVLLLVEKSFLHFVAIRFHRKALADRLAENKLALRALDKLSNGLPMYAKKMAQGRRKGYGQKTPPLQPSSTRSASYIALSKLGGPLGHQSARGHGHDKSHPTGGSEVVAEKGHAHRHNHREKDKEKRQRRKMAASVIMEQVGDVIGAVALKDSRFNREGEMGSLSSARKLARQLFATLSDVQPPRAHLIVSDFYPYFRTREEAEVAFQLIDKDGNGDISKREMREAVQRIYRERKSLIASLKDVSSAIAKLDGVLLFVAFLGMAFSALLIFDRSNALESLVPLATVVLGFSFIFGHSAQTLFESLIFIFSTHVFDVGDLVMIDDDVLLVREFGLISTTFRRVDGQEIIAPNAVLASKKLIHNLRRSGSMWESTVLHVAYESPLEVIEQLKSRLKAYVNENNREWLDCAVNVDKIEYQNAIWLTIGMQHKSNWQNWGGRWERRTAFMRNLKNVLEDLEIGYSKPLQPILVHPSAALAALRTSQGMEDRGERDSHGRDTELGNAGGFTVV